MALKTIVAEMRPDWVEPYARMGGTIPVVTLSNHPRFTTGTRLDWDFVSIALQDGYALHIAPLAVGAGAGQ